MGYNVDPLNFPHDLLDLRQPDDPITRRHQMIMSRLFFVRAELFQLAEDGLKPAEMVVGTQAEWVTQIGNAKTGVSSAVTALTKIIKDDF